MGKSKAPKPSQQELQLMEQQRLMLGWQQEQMQKQQQQQDLLQPILLSQMGITPRYENGQLVGYDRQETSEQALYRQQMESLLAQQPQQAAYQQQLMDLASQQAAYQQQQAPVQAQLQEQYLRLAQQQADYQETQQRWQQEFEPQLKQQYADQLAFQKQAMDFQQQQIAQYEEQQRLQPLLYEASGVRPIYDPETGQITSFQLTERAQARQDYEDQLIEHQRKALAGELDADPVLERALQEGETQLRAKLQAQLGVGYETSTPGIQAIEEFRRRAAEARSAVAHGQMVDTQNVLANQQQLNRSAMAGAYGGRELLGEYGLRPVAFGQGVQVPTMGQVQAPSLGLFQAGSPTGYAGGIQGILGGQAGGGGAGYGNLAQGFGQLAGTLGQMQTRRQNQEAQMQQQYAQQMGQIGTIAGSVLGGVVGSVVPGLGTAAGAGAGATLGGAAGSYYGYSQY